MLPILSKSRRWLNQYPFKRGKLHVLEGLPGSLLSDELGLVEADHGLGEGIVIRISPGVHRGHGSRLGQAFRVADGEVLGSSVTVVHESFDVTLPAPKRHLQSIKGQAGA